MFLDRFSNRYIQNSGSRVEFEVAGFFVFSSLGYSNVIENPAGLNWPRRIRATHRGYKCKESYCENAKKPAKSDFSLDPYFFSRLLQIFKTFESVWCPSVCLSIMYFRERRNSLSNRFFCKDFAYAHLVYLTYLVR